MNAAQIAHALKWLGRGRECLGIARVYNIGRLVGAAQTLAVVGAGCAVYFAGKWGAEKLAELRREQRLFAKADAG